MAIFRVSANLNELGSAGNFETLASEWGLTLSDSTRTLSRDASYFTLGSYGCKVVSNVNTFSAYRFPLSLIRSSLNDNIVYGKRYQVVANVRVPEATYFASDTCKFGFENIIIPYLYYEDSKTVAQAKAEWVTVEGRFVGSIVSSQPYLQLYPGTLTDQPNNNGKLWVDEFEIYEIYDSDEDPLTVSGTKVDPTSIGASDGKITATVELGSGNYNVKIRRLSDNVVIHDVNINGVPASTLKTGLAAGDYRIEVEDLVSGDTDQSVVITILDPAVPPPTGNYFDIPKTNSLEFVHEVTPNDCEIFQTHDNVRFCKQEHPFFGKTEYYQKVAKCDNIVTQFRSNYTTHTIEMFNYNTDALITSWVAQLKENNINKELYYSVLIRNHGSGKSRLYFNTGSIPLELSLKAGDSFFIANNADGFDGGYTIESIETDFSLNSEYIVFVKNYALSAASSSATGIFFSSVQNYNVYEVEHTGLGVIADGLYYIKIRAWDSSSEAVPAITEPISLKTKHENTNLIEYRNYDNAFNMTYTTGLICRIRVESILFKRLPSAERNVIRNGDGKLIKTYAQKYRKFMFEFFQLPPYLHEKLSVIFDHDLIKINGVEYQTDENLKDPDYKPRYRLANSSIIVEQVGWFDTYNTNDIKPIEESGFVIANEGYIKR